MAAPRQGLRLPRRPRTRTITAPRTSTPSPTGLAPLAAPKPAAPTAPYTPTAQAGQAPKLTQPLPVDPAYDAQEGTLRRRRDTTLGDLDSQQQRGLLDYGYTPNLQFDPTNVFSRAAQLRKRYVEAQKGNVNGMAAAGQLRSGAALRGAANIDYANSAANDALQKQATDFLARIQRQRTGAQTDYELGVGTAMGERIARAPSNPLYTPTDTTVYTNKDSGYQRLAPGYGIQNGRFVKLVNGKWVLA